VHAPIPCPGSGTYSCGPVSQALARTSMVVSLPMVSIDQLPEPHHGYRVYTETVKEVSGQLPSGGYTSRTKTLTVSSPVAPIHWRIGIVSQKTNQPEPGPKGTSGPGSEITVQLTADQQVNLSITGEDKYGNPVDISGDVLWRSSDESIIVVQPQAGAPGSASAVAAAVGPVGTAAVTVTNDVNSDGTGDFIGSLAIDVVAGNIAEITVNEGEITNKDQALVR